MNSQIMHHKNQSTTSSQYSLNSRVILDLIKSRDQIFQKLNGELLLNQQLMNQLLNPMISQSTNSGGSSGSHASSRSNEINGSNNGSQAKSESQESVLFIKKQESGQNEEDNQNYDNASSYRNSLVNRNDTKNIPKNYGKAILSFVQKSPLSRKLAAEMGISYSDLMINVRRFKKRVNSIETLRKMWGSENLDHKIKKCIRILSYHFMRKHCLKYIFHSKVRNYGTHIKYRTKLIQGIQNPKQFNHIKDY